MSKTLKIGNAGGYWGDDPHALERQLKCGDLDYITMDFLAEITMSILQKQRSRDPEMGYAHDFLKMLKNTLSLAIEKNVTIITNAGGVNPKSCARAIEKLGEELGLKPKISVVFGDDIKDSIPTLREKGASFKNMETGESFDSIADRVEAANIYFGAAPVVEALKSKPNIIVTGRVTDTGITVAPMIHEFNWKLSDWDKVASGIVAGHILECGSQSTGGNFTDWEKVPTFDEIGFPIVEVSEDGTFIVTKHNNTGGLVSVDTVREQLFYEMGDPKAYLTPDVVADFSSIQLADAGQNRVRVFGVKGFEPTPLYKISMAYADGYKAVGEIAISGPNARAKAETFADVFWKKLNLNFEGRETEYFGWNACHKSLGHQEDGNEIILRLGARDSDRDKLRAFGKMIPALILSGPPGVCVLGGVPRIQEVVSYWPALMDKNLVKPVITSAEDLSQETIIDSTETGNFSANNVAVQRAESNKAQVKDLLAAQSSASDWQPLSRICLARSGDKGDTANIGLIARSEKAYQFIKEMISAQTVKDLFQEICFGTVIRYELDNMHGLNFLLEHSLGGGGTKTLRVDAQGKTFGQALLRQKFQIPEDVLNSVE